MKNEEKLELLYIGLHPGSLIFIDKDPFKVIGTSYLDFLAEASLNPANLLFSLAYIAHCKKLPRAVVLLLLWVWYSVQWLMTGYRSRYRSYLTHLIHRKINVIDAENPNNISNFITENEIDLLVLNGWSLLPKSLVTMPRLGSVNVHPSILPKYRGALPTLWTLKNHDEESAVSLILLAAGIDTGPMISQRTFRIDSADSAITLEGKIDQILEQYLWSDIHEYISGQSQLIEQAGEVSTTDKYTEYVNIQWGDETARDIVNKVLLYPFLEPGLYAQSDLGKSPVRLKSASESPIDLDIKPGAFKLRFLTVLVKTKNGTVSLRLFKDLNFVDSLRLMLTKPQIWSQYSC